jgi:hypothetical protein
MNLTGVEFASKWIAGDIFYRNGIVGTIDSKDTEYDEAVTGAYNPSEAAYVGESPRDPYEHGHALNYLKTHSNCPNSIGGISGKLWQAQGTWQSSCKMFY